MKKTWSTQPDELVNVSIITSFYSDGKHVEIRGSGCGNYYYLSVGNLFGQETVKIEGCKNVFIALNKVLNISGGKTISASSLDGVTLL